MVLSITNICVVSLSHGFEVHSKKRTNHMHCLNDVLMTLDKKCKRVCYHIESSRLKEYMDVHMQFQTSLEHTPAKLDKIIKLHMLLLT